MASVKRLWPQQIAAALLVCSAWHVCSADTSAQRPTQRPNVLFIAVDDMRCELGCYGSPIARSPNIDRLAQRGLVFERAYCQQALCNPSRASLLTGLQIDTLGFADLPTHFREKHPDIVTLPQLFKQAGYAAHGIGKIFHNYRQDNWRGDPASWSRPQLLHYGSHSADVAQVSGPVPDDLISIPRAESRDVPDDAYWDGQIAKEAVARLRELNGEPFFLAVGFWKPHLPFNAPAKYWRMYDETTIDLPPNPDAPEGAPPIALHESKELLRDYKKGLTDDHTRKLRHGYYAAISYVDAQIGTVLDELDRLELADNTIVVFWSDHGFHLGEHSLWCKNTNFELDARVPLIVSLPGQSTAGRRTKALAELLDIYPTLADTCNLTPSHSLEGVSLRPVLDGEADSVRPFALTQNPRPAYRKGKADPTVMGYSVRTDRYRYTQWRSIGTGDLLAEELYDHDIDSMETKNRVDDVEMAKVVAEHIELLQPHLPEKAAIEKGVQ